MHDNDIEQMIQDRNRLLLSFFEHHLPKNTVRVTGNPNSPVVIIQNQFMANCYVKNFTIHFTDGQKNGPVIYTHKMSTDYPNRHGNHEEFTQWYDTYPMKRCFKVRIRNTSLYYTGHNYLDNNTEFKNIYPVFAEYEPKIFYTKSYANNLIHELQNSKIELTQPLEVE